MLRKVKEFDPDILVILLTAYATIETAVEAMKLGAYHFANKPFNLDDVSATVERALETTRLRREIRQFRDRRGAAVQPPQHRRQLPGDHGASPPGGQGGDEPGINRVADRRERNGQGSGGEGAPLRERAAPPSIHEHHVLGPAGAVAGKRAIRS